MPPVHFRPPSAGRSAWSARTGLAVGAGAAVALAVAAGLALSAAGWPGGGRPSAAPATGAPAPVHRSPSAAAPSAAVPSAAVPSGRLAGQLAGPPATGQVATSTELATVRGVAPRYASPGQQATGTVPATWYGRPSVLPVIAVRPGWVEVRLAQRPNESTAWLPATDVTLSATPYEIVVDLATTKLSLFNEGRLVFSAPAGVGSADDPTPVGQYFVAFDEQPPQPNPGYGPFIMVTSAHSEAIADWEGSGDAVIGIHGPLGEDSLIGTSGAKISHGCIRLHDQALEELTEVLPGTPIDIIG